MKEAHFCSSRTPSGNIWSSVGWSIWAQLPPPEAGGGVVGVDDEVGDGAVTAPVVILAPSGEVHEVAPPEATVAVMHDHPSISTNPPLPCGVDGGSW